MGFKPCASALFPNQRVARNLALFLLPAAIIILNGACTKKKVDNALHLVFLENPKSLDPALSSDAWANEAIGSVYETLLEYHYLKRPYTLQPLLAEKMPEYSKDGLTVTIHIKKGVKFQDDRCFEKNKGRDVTAQDFIYGFKRIADPKIQSDGWWVFDNKIVGFNGWREKASKAQATDYSAPVEGLQAPDSHTLIIKLNKKYPQLNYVLAMNYTSPIPHEAIEKYGPDFANHPVGTGPFVITNFTRSSQIVYEKNPNFHGETFPDDKGFSSTPEMKNFDFGKALPLSDKIIVHIFLEDQPAWLQFNKGQVDLIRLPKDSFKNTVGDDHELRPEFAKKGISLTKNPSTTEWFFGFNMEDPVVGKNKFLRKAIGLAYDSAKDIDLFTNGLGAPANQILPPGIEGYDGSLPPREYNIEKARQLLTKGGNPNGVGLPKLFFDTEASTRARQMGEFFKEEMAKIGIQIEVRTNQRPELMDKKRKGKLQIHMDGWIADYPDAENFMQLLFGPNRPPGPNNEAFNNDEFNKLYEQMAGMAPSPERNKVIKRMTAIMLEESPWVPNWVATLYYLNQGWMKNYRYSDFSYNNYKYYRVDLAEKERLLKTF